jgi:hypothetical protein
MKGRNLAYIIIYLFLFVQTNNISITTIIIFVATFARGRKNDDFLGPTTTVEEPLKSICTVAIEEEAASILQQQLWIVTMEVVVVLRQEEGDDSSIIEWKNLL